MLALTLASVFFGVSHLQGIIVTVNGTPVDFPDAQPRMVQGRVLVPLRGAFEAMKATVNWDPTTQTVICYKNDKTVKLQIDSGWAEVNGTRVPMDVPAQIINHRTMIPLRLISESLGCDVTWDAMTQTVVIESVLIKPAKTS